MEPIKNHQSMSLFDNRENEHLSKGSIIRKPGSNRLYILFYYYKQRIEKTTGLEDTFENREKVQTHLHHLITLRNSGSLVFAEAFPGSSEKEKSYFAKCEGANYAPPPKNILFGTYAKHWKDTISDHFDSHTLKITYDDVIGYWLLPYFKDMPFSQINSVEIKKFMATFRQKKGKNEGKRLSKARAKNIITVFRTVYFDAIDEYGWVNLPDPFRGSKKNLPKTPPKERGVFRFDEWAKIVQQLEPWLRPMIEVMVMTGMMPSEVCGLRKSDITADHVIVRNSIVLKVESADLKSKYRYRKIPITKAIRQKLQEAMVRNDNEHVFTKPDGTSFYWANFEKYWARVLKAAGVPYQPPYSVRHTFAAWALTLRVDPLKLVSLMGHGSKKMVFDIYGNYVEGLEEDIWSMLEYFGRDFIEKQKPRQIQPLEYYVNLGSGPIGIGLCTPKNESPYCTSKIYGESLVKVGGSDNITN